MPDRSPFLTVAEAAALLRLSTRAIYRHVADGTLPAIRIGTTVRIPRAALELDDAKPRRRRVS
jgi:excisionase family DNA binding protein